MKKETTKKKIASLIWHDSIGGAERSLTDLATALDRDKFNMRFYYLSGEPGIFAKKLQKLGFQTIFLKWNSGADLAGRYRLIKQLKRYQPDLIHDHILPPLTRPILKLFMRCPILNTEHGRANIALSNKNNFTLRKLVEHFDLIFCDLIAANSHTSANALKTLYSIPTNKIKIIHLGIDLDNFQQPKKDHSKFTIGYLGRIKNSHKGVDSLPKVAKKMQELAPEDFTFIIAGDGVDRKQTEEDCKAMGIEKKFQFLGWITDVQDFLATIDALVIPSRFESLGLTALEALAMNVPVVAFDVGGLRETLERCPEGFLIPPEDTVEMARVLITILQRPTETKDIARTFVDRNFSNYVMADKLEKIYLEMIQQ